MNQNTIPRTTLRELALLFLKLGTFAFGGPAAHIAMMKDEVVNRRHWLSEAEFLDYLGATNLIPGPNSTEMAIHVGHQRRGWAGLLVAGACFIIPAMLIVWTIAWAYVKFGTLPRIAGVFYGVKPVVIAIVLQALWGLGKTAIKTRALAGLGALSLMANAFGLSEVAIVLGAGLAAMLVFRFKARTGCSSSLMAWMALTVLPLVSASKAFAQTVASKTPVELSKIFLLFLKIGSILFGSGYVLLAFLRADFVEHLHWLTESQLLDATAVGQFTPGPVFTTATFIGYVLAGSRGAILATLGIFLPAFFFVAVSAPLVPRIRKSPLAGAFLDGVNVGSLALMAFVTIQLGRGTLIDPLTIAVAVGSALLLIRYKVNSVWLVLAGAMIGYLHQA